MNPADRAFWVVGLATVVFVILYWTQLVSAYRHRAAIEAAAQIAESYDNAQGGP